MYIKLSFSSLVCPVITEGEYAIMENLDYWLEGVVQSGKIDFLYIKHNYTLLYTSCFHVPIVFLIVIYIGISLSCSCGSWWDTWKHSLVLCIDEAGNEELL